MYNDGANRMGVVEFNGERRAVYLSLVTEAHVVDNILFKAGLATERIDSAPRRPPRRATRMQHGKTMSCGRTRLTGFSVTSTRSNFENCSPSRKISNMHAVRSFFAQKRDRCSCT
jgi:hypothetical protein